MPNSPTPVTVEPSFLTDCGRDKGWSVSDCFVDVEPSDNHGETVTVFTWHMVDRDGDYMGCVQAVSDGASAEWTWLEFTV